MTEEHVDDFTADDIKSLIRGIGEPSPTRKALETALSLWGYDYHNPLATMRHNDGLVRRMAAASLHAAADALGSAASKYKQARVPEPTRAIPFPTNEARLAMARGNDLAKRIRGYASIISAMETPITDGFAKQLRAERETLENLITADIQAVIAARRIATLASAVSIDDLDTSVRTDEIARACDVYESVIRNRAKSIQI